MFPLFLTAQVYQGDIWLSSQAQVDSFPLKYSGIKRVAGNFVVGIADTVNLTDITDLSPLAGLEYVFYLYISNNGMLSSLQGLEAMDTLYSVTIYHNPKLQSLYGLHKLRKSDGIAIRQNDTLPNLQGLNSLQYSKSFSVERCKNLTSFEGLDSLHSTFFGMTIADNPRLKSIRGMNRLKDTDMDIFNNDSLLHLGYFPQLKRCALRISGNQNLVDFMDLGDHVPETMGLGIYSNPNLISIDPIKKANWFGLGTGGNPLLSKIFLDSIGFGNIDISGPAINEIRFAKANEYNFFKVHDCPQLKTLENTLPLADSINYYYEIYDNDSLTLLHEDWGPRYIKDLLVYDNPSLTEISGYEGLEETYLQPYNTSICFECGAYLTSPNLQVVEGFNNLKKGQVFIQNLLPISERVVGFNGMGAELFRVKFWSKFKQILGFNNVTKVHDAIYIQPTQDTLSVFRNLVDMGPPTGLGDTRELRVDSRTSCRPDPACFGKLQKIRGLSVSNAGYGGGGSLFKFPLLEIADLSNIGTNNNPDVVSLIGIYPALKKVGKVWASACPRLKSLDGIEGIAEFRQTAPAGYFMSASDCDSLADCSAICWLLEHANFVPANVSPRAYLDNPLFPCDDAASVEHWCDTLTVSTKPEPNLAASPPMRLYPNPVQGGYLNIEMNDPELSGQYEISVSDAAGKVALAGRLTFTEGDAVLNTTMLAPGWYQLSVRQREGRVRSAAFVRQGE
ncbi:MAG: T9SS type A sorting domain-containing protein [Saprospiraceae bacterium]